MNTKDFNFIDMVIAGLRFRKIVDFIEKDECILDFGCGVKSFLLKKVGKKIKLGVGLDYDVKNGKQGNIEYINFRYNKKLPFENKSFDKIFLLAVLEHIEVEKVEGLFLELKRVLKNDGKIVLTTPTPKSKKILEFLAYKIKLISSQEVGDHKKYYNKREILRLIKMSALKLTDYRLFQFGLNSLVVFKKS